MVAPVRRAASGSAGKGQESEVRSQKAGARSQEPGARSHAFSVQLTLTTDYWLLNHACLGWATLRIFR